jgi:hypothetical protein
MSMSRGATIQQRAAAVAVALGLAGSPLPLRAEEPPRGAPLQVGDRVRVETSTSAKGTTGEVIGIGPDGLRLRASDRPLPVDVPLSSVTRLERSLGKRSNAGKGALLGGLVGAAAGVALVLVARGEDCDGPCTPYAAIVGAGFVGAGTVLGAITGAAIKTERWEAASLGRIGVSAAPRPRGGAVALSVRF